VKIIIIILLSLALLFSCNNDIIPEKKKVIKQIENEISIKEKQEILWNKIHIKTPEKVESLYYSVSGITNKKKFDNLLNIAKNTSINSVIIDIKEVD